MEEEKVPEIFVELVKAVMEGRSTEFVLISTNEIYSITRTFIKATKKVIKMFQNLVDATGWSYANQILEGKQDLKLLLAHLQYRNCLEFYKKELKTAKSMTQEYRTYVRSGHILKTLLNIPRAEEDMVDYRTLPWSWF